MDIMLGLWCAFLFFVSGFVIGRIRWGREKTRAYGPGEGQGAAAEEMRREYGSAAGYENAGEGGREGSSRERSNRERSNREWDSLDGEMGARKEADSRKRMWHSGRAARKRPVPGEKRIPLGWAIASPITGQVKFLHEGTMRGALITPEQEMVYAPASGKITRLYPTGNAMRLRTDSGIELLIRAGVDTGELEGRYYRPRVVQNEVVNKGKPLLEFDVEGIRGEGFDPAVMVSVEEAADYRDVTVCQAARVKVGDDLMWVRR